MYQTEDQQKTVLEYNKSLYFFFDNKSLYNKFVFFVTHSLSLCPRWQNNIYLFIYFIYLLQHTVHYTESYSTTLQHYRMQCTTESYSTTLQHYSMQCTTESYSTTLKHYCMQCNTTTYSDTCSTAYSVEMYRVFASASASADNSHCFNIRIHIRIRGCG